MREVVSMLSNRNYLATSFYFLMEIFLIHPSQNLECIVLLELLRALYLRTLNASTTGPFSRPSQAKPSS